MPKKETLSIVLTATPISVIKQLNFHQLYQTSLVTMKSSNFPNSLCGSHHHLAPDKSLKLSQKFLAATILLHLKQEKSFTHILTLLGSSVIYTEVSANSDTRNSATEVVITTVSSTQPIFIDTIKDKGRLYTSSCKKILPSWNLLYSKMPQTLTPLLLVSSSAPIVNHSAKHSSQIIRTPIPSAKVYSPYHNQFSFKGCKVTPI